MRDSSRLTADGPRVVQITAWYPAAVAASASVMRYADYVALGASERGETVSAESDLRAVAGFSDFLVRNGVPKADVARWLESAMLAWRDAPGPPGRHPVVLIAQGNGQAAYSQAVLAEYLASRGFVVATTPSPGRIGPAMQSEDDILPVATAQAEDLALALRELVRRGWSDSGRVAVAGHSFGARAALLLLANRTASMLISLDGGIANAQGRQWIDHSAIDPATIRGQVLHVFQEGDTIVRPDFTLLRRMKGAARLLVRAEGLSHWHFTSFGTISAAFPTVAPGATDAARSHTASAVMALTACALDGWSRASRTLPDACLDQGNGLHVVERLAGVIPP